MSTHSTLLLTRLTAPRRAVGSGCVVLKAWDAGHPYYRRALRPWVHYVPIEHDLSDLIARIEWLRKHDADPQVASFTDFSEQPRSPCMSIAT